MYDDNENQFESRGEKVSYQPAPVPTPEPQPVPVPKPAPVVSKEIPKHEVESSPDHEWEHEHKPKKHYLILKTLHKSMVMSEQMIHVLLSAPMVEQRRKQIQLLYECSDACSTTMRCISRNSPFSGKMAKMCARVCGTYHRECSHYTDIKSQNVSQTLLHCANECRDFHKTFKYY